MTADLAASYGKALRARVPQAGVVYDRFPLETAGGRRGRRRPPRRATPPGKDGRQSPQGDALRAAETSGAAQAEPGATTGHTAPREPGLNRAYELKEYLATILEQAKPEEADELLNQWLDWAARSRLAPFVKLARTVRKHAAGILAYLDTKMTNGPVEGINNKLRVIARRAYGFHSPGPLISMLYLCCGGIQLDPPLPTRI